MAGSWMIGIGEGLKGAAQGVGTYQNLKQQALENALRQEAEKRQAQQLAMQEAGQRAEEEYRKQSLGLQGQQLEETRRQHDATTRNQQQANQINMWENMRGGFKDPSVGEAFDPAIRPFVGEEVDIPDKITPFAGPLGAPQFDSWKKSFKMGETPADQKAAIEKAQNDAILARITGQMELGRERNANAGRNADSAAARVEAMIKAMEATQARDQAQQALRQQTAQNEAWEAARKQAVDELETVPGMLEATARAEKKPVSQVIDERAKVIMQGSPLYSSRGPVQGGGQPVMPKINF